MVKPRSNGLASSIKLKTWVYLPGLACTCVYLRWLAITLVGIKFACKSIRVFYSLATQRKSLRKFNLPLLATTCESVWPGLNSTSKFIRRWFEPRREIPWLKKIIWVAGALRGTVVGDRRFDNLCGSHLQSQVIASVCWKFKNPGERFDWSIDRVAVGKWMMWLAVKTRGKVMYLCCSE